MHDLEWFGYEDNSDEEAQRMALWEEDGPATLVDENLTWVSTNGRISLMGRGGYLQTFTPDAELDAALAEAYTKVMG